MELLTLISFLQALEPVIFNLDEMFPDLEHQRMRYLCLAFVRA